MTGVVETGLFFGLVDAAYFGDTVSGQRKYHHLSGAVLTW